MNPELNITNPNIYSFLILGIIIYFTFRLLLFANKKILYRDILKMRVNKIIFIVELFTWFIFLFKSIQTFYIENQLFSYILIFVLAFLTIWTSWYIFKDYLAGLYFKISGKYKINDVISFDTISGKIKKITERKLILETTGLENIEVPYSKLFDKYIKISSNVGSFSKADFLIKIDNKSDIEQISKQIKIALIQLPWTNIKDNPSIEIERHEKNAVCLRITASIIDSKYKSALESKIKEKFEK